MNVPLHMSQLRRVIGSLTSCPIVPPSLMMGCSQLSMSTNAFSMPMVDVPPSIIYFYCRVYGCEFDLGVGEPVDKVEFAFSRELIGSEVREVFVSAYFEE